MTPRFPLRDDAHKRTTDSKAISNFLLSELGIPRQIYNLADALLSEFGSVPLTKRMASTLDHISGVICGCPEKEVRRITTRRVVTGVPDDLPFGHLTSVVEFPRDDMSVTNSIAPSTQTDLPMPLSMAVAQPLPTLVVTTSINFSPKAALQRLHINPATRV